MAGRVVVAEGMLSPGRFYFFEQRGAIAQVYVNKGNAHELTVSTIWGAPTPESIGAPADDARHHASLASRARGCWIGSRRKKR